MSNYSNQLPSTSSNINFMDDMDDEVFLFSQCCEKEDMGCNIENINNTDNTTNNEKVPEFTVTSNSNGLKKFNDNKENNMNVNILTKVNSLIEKIPKITNENNGLAEAEKMRLENEIFTYRGLLKTTELNSQSKISARDLEIRQLKEQMHKIKTESEKSIQVLTSKLEFKEASLHGAQQNLLSMKSFTEFLTQPAIDESDSDSSIKPATKIVPVIQRPKKRKISFDETQRPSKLKSVSFLEFDNAFLDDDFPETTQFKPPDSVSTVSIACNTSDDFPTVNEIFPEVHRIQNDQPQESEVELSFELNITDDDADWDLIDFSEIKPTDDCCFSIKCDQMWLCSAKALHKLAPISRSCMNIHNEMELPLSHCMVDICKFIGYQFQKITIPICQRFGGISDSLDNILARKVFKRSDLLKNPQYFCLFHYMYPILEVLTRMSRIVPYQPLLLADFLSDCILLHFFDMVNHLVIEFCCPPHKADVDDAIVCDSFTKAYENGFAQQILQFALFVISQSSGDKQVKIFKIIFSHFKKLMPLFGAKLDLKIVIIELFCQMLQYQRFLIWINEHDNGFCVLKIVLNILNCGCLSSYKETELCRLTVFIARIILALCDSKFRWKPACQCSTEIHSLVNNVILNMAKSVSDTEWTYINRESLMFILSACNQLKLSCDALPKLQSLEIEDYKSHLNHAVFEQHPIVLDNVYYFNQLIKDSVLPKI